MLCSAIGSPSQQARSLFEGVHNVLDLSAVLAPCRDITLILTDRVIVPGWVACTGHSVVYI